MKDNHTWVICAYGESDYLEVCIQSLKNQTLQSQMCIRDRLWDAHWQTF